MITPLLLEDLFADKIEQNLQNNITDKPQRMFILPEAKDYDVCQHRHISGIIV